MDKNKKKSQNQISDDALGNVSGGAVNIDATVTLTSSDADQYLKSDTFKNSSYSSGGSYGTGGFYGTGGSYGTGGYYGY